MMEESTQPQATYEPTQEVSSQEQWEQGESFSEETVYQLADYSNYRFDVTNPIESETTTTQEKKKGFRSSLRNFLENAVRGGEKLVGDAEREINFHTQDSWVRFAHLFNIPNDALLGEFKGRAVNGVGTVDVLCFISYHHFSFAQYVGNQFPLRVAFPLREIEHIQQACASDTSKPTISISLPTESGKDENGNLIVTDVIQIFTTDKRVHQFFGFGAQYPTVWNMLLHAWQAIHKKQVPGYMYSETEERQSTSFPTTAPAQGPLPPQPTRESPQPIIMPNYQQLHQAKKAQQKSRKKEKGKEKVKEKEMEKEMEKEKHSPTTTQQEQSTYMRSEE